MLPQARGYHCLATGQGGREPGEKSEIRQNAETLFRNFYRMRETWIISLFFSAQAIERICDKVFFPRCTHFHFSHCRKSWGEAQAHPQSLTGRSVGFFFSPGQRLASLLPGTSERPRDSRFFRMCGTEKHVSLCGGLSPWFSLRAINLDYLRERLA